MDTSTRVVRFSERWPLGPDSPEDKGRPRRIEDHIRDGLTASSSRDEVMAPPVEERTVLAPVRKLTAVCERGRAMRAGSALGVAPGPHVTRSATGGLPCRCRSTG